MTASARDFCAGDLVVTVRQPGVWRLVKMTWDIRAGILAPVDGLAWTFAYACLGQARTMAVSPVHMRLTAQALLRRRSRRQ